MQYCQGTSEEGRTSLLRNTNDVASVENETEWDMTQQRVFHVIHIHVDMITMIKRLQSTTLEWKMEKERGK